MRFDPDELLSSKELALALKRSLKYVYMMRLRGFSMPGDRTTLRIALLWLRRNPRPSTKRSPVPRSSA